MNVSTPWIPAHRRSVKQPYKPQLSLFQEWRHFWVHKIMENLLNPRRTVREDMGNQFEHLIKTEHLEHSKTRAVLSNHSKSQLEPRVKRTILESLRFPTRTVRHETIPDAHQRTFEWIFRDPDPDGKPW
jgi:hypothetical protein